MITPRANVPLLYAQRMPIRWLRTLKSTVDEAAADLCRDLWQHGVGEALQPARAVRPSRLRER